MTRFAVLLAALLSTAPALAHDMAGMDHGEPAGTVTISEAMIAAAPGPNAAAYASIANAGAEPDRLVAVKGDVAAAVELHAMASEDGVMKMRPLDGLDIPAGGSVALSEGGAHIMLIGLKAPLAADSTVTLTFVFAKAGEMAVELPVHAMGGGGHDHHAH